MIYKKYNFFSSYERILLLAPHPDDEIFSCGGLLGKIMGNNDKMINVIYISDGGKGHPEWTISSNMVLQRKNEANSVMNRLGINRYGFWNYPDGELEKYQSYIEHKLRDTINKITPEIVLCPHKQDEHPDHIATAKALKNILKEYKKILYIGYEMWKKIQQPNLYVTLSKKEIEQKLQCVEIYKSQLQIFDYRSLLIKSMQQRGDEINEDYAEAFIAYF